MHKMNELQSCILDIFKEISRICEANDIPYFAIGGTCIGAVRHGGFIPWDDDIDIAIPIEYFDTFKHVCLRDLPEYYEFYDGSKVTHYANIFIKIIDNRTTFIEDVTIDYPDSYKGVFVDVMPLSGIPASTLNRNLFFLKQHFLNIANYARRFSLQEMPTHQIKMIWLLLKPIHTVLPFDVWSNKWLALLKKYPLSQSALTGYVWSSRVKELVFPTEYFHNTEFLPFENTYISCPSGYDLYLSKQFGDYLTLPNMKDRASGHNGIVDLKRPYKEYVISKTKGGE